MQRRRMIALRVVLASTVIKPNKVQVHRAKTALRVVGRPLQEQVGVWEQLRALRVTKVDTIH